MPKKNQQFSIEDEQPSVEFRTGFKVIRLYWTYEPVPVDPYFVNRFIFVEYSRIDSVNIFGSQILHARGKKFRSHPCHDAANLFPCNAIRMHPHTRGRVINCLANTS